MKVHPTVSKKLQRLPHVFAKVLQLPFPSDTEISVQETSEFFLFTAVTNDRIENVRVHAMDIYSGVTKVVIRRLDGGNFLFDEAGLDLWRFRLPASARPEMVTARYCSGKLLVTVPKSVCLENTEEGGGTGKYITNEENGNIFFRSDAIS